MSTRSFIGFDRGPVPNGERLIGQYCHYDGYPGHVGAILAKFHTSLTSLTEIIEGGQIRNFDVDGTICRFGDGEGSTEEFVNLAEVLNHGYDYAYLWTDEGWKCYGRDRDMLVKQFDIPEEV